MTTLSAKSLLLKPAFTFVFTSIRVLPSSVIRGVTCSRSTYPEAAFYAAISRDSAPLVLQLPPGLLVLLANPGKDPVP